MFSRVVRRQLQNLSSRFNQRGNRVSKVIKRNYTTENPPKTTKPKIEDGQYTPQADKVKNFKAVSIIFGAVSTFYAAIDIYANYFLASKVEVTPEIDGYTESMWLQVSTAFSDGIVGSGNAILSGFQTLSKAGIVEKGVAQLTVAINRLVEIDQDLRSGRKTLNAATQAQIDQILSVCDNIENSLSALAALEVNAKKLVALGVMEHVTILNTLLPERYIVNMKLVYALRKHASVSGEVAKYDTKLPQLTDQDELLVQSNKLEKKGLLDSTLAVIGVSGALYCGIVWKIMYPRIPGGRLMYKMAWGLVGCSLPYLIEATTSRFSKSPAAIQAINDNIAGKKENPMYSSNVLLSVELTSIFGTMLAFLVPWYHSKFILFPGFFAGPLYAVISNYYEQNYGTPKPKISA